MLGRVTHEEARALLSQYAAGALDLAVAADVRRHLTTGCGECLRDLYAQRSRRPAPVVHATRTAARRRRTSVFAPLTMLVGAAVLVTVVTAWTMHTDGDPGAPWSLLAHRIAVLEADRTDVGRRLAELTRALLDARDRVEHLATPPAPSIAESDPARPDADALDEPAVESDDRRASIRYAENALSMRVNDMPLADVLHEIGRQSGMTVKGTVPDGRAVTVAFEDIPFQQALRRLLGVQNFLLTYDGRRPSVLEVLAAPDTPPAVVAAREEKPPARDGVAAAQSIATLLDAHAAVALSDGDAAALGARAMPLRRLLDTGVNHVDKDVRVTAIRAAVDALQSDPTLRAAMFGSRPGMAEGIFGALVENMETARAEELLFYVATAAQDSEVRNSAAALIQRVATSGTPHRES